MTSPISMEAGGPASRLSVIQQSRKGGMRLSVKPPYGFADVRTALGGCAHNYNPPKSATTARAGEAPVDPPKPVEIVELPKPLPLPGQLKPLAGASRRRKPPIPTVRVDQANAAARDAADAQRLHQRHPGLSVRRWRALPGLYRARRNHRHRAAGRASSSSAPARSPPATPCAGSSATPRAARAPTKQVHILVKPTRPDLVTNLVINTDRRTYHPGAALDREDLHGLGLLAISRRPAHRAAAAEQGGRRSRADCHRRRSRLDQFPLRRSRATTRPGVRCAPSTTGTRSTSSSRAALRRAKCRRCSSSARPAAPSWSTTGSAATTTSSTACSPPPNCVSATRIASGASASSAPTEGRGHDGGRS